MSNALIRTIAPETPVFREAPHNLEAEQALLGAILVNNEAIDRVSNFLKPGHFYDPLHAEVQPRITVNVARSADEAARQARGEDTSRAMTEAEENAEAARVAAEALFEEGAPAEIAGPAA